MGEKELKIKFVMKLGRCLQEFGTTAFRIEDSLRTLSQHLGLNGSFFSTPTVFMANFKDEKDDISRLERVSPGPINLDKLASVDNVGDMVSQGRLGPREGGQKLDAIISRPNKYNSFWVVLAFSLSSSCFSLFLGGGYENALVALLFGFLIGFLDFLATKFSRLERIFEAICALIISLLAYLISSYFPHLNPQVLIVSGLIILIPGLTLTNAAKELATNHLASGTARMMGALMVLLKISFGVALGKQILAFTGPALSKASFIALNHFQELLVICVAASSFIVIFQVSPKDIPWVLLSGIFGVYGQKMGDHLFGPELGVFLAGIIVGVYGNLFARLINRPASIVLVPGIIFLVPGSIGFKGISLLFGKAHLEGMATVFSMVAITISLVAGLIFANFIIGPRRNL